MIIYSQASKYGFKQELIVDINLHYLLFIIWRATQHYADFNVQVLVAMDNKNMDKENF
jgi:TetR/AcrR family transcriptional regulator